ncbi:STAS domain-containing protein [Telmatospirillum siberiense]|uniref:Anti-sigma factor antagonist n=1 Tax=Telmatospirillum siberiense TaxID=382514 RepID=A0A2N3PUB5_9PROT|nr:STAS domain-containing protein [Telmatospirillum siberiense]PKU23980.1 anti-sigma factor antagonist [Telmatospirillum siberiense]
MSANFSTRHVKGGVVVALQGEIDLQNSPELRKELLSWLAERRDVVVDLQGVAYIDSSGIASLVEAYQTARHQGGRFRLAAVSPAALRVLKLARLDEVFVIRETVEQALKGD